MVSFGKQERVYHKRVYHNGRRHPPATKQNARRLRRSGLSYGVIVKILGISRGTAWLWTHDIVLTAKQREIIEEARKNHPNNEHIFSPAERRAYGKRMSRINTKYSKQILLKKIVHFYKVNGRIPLKREFNNFRLFSKHFGSWNKAIVAAGFEPNPEFFAKKEVAKDGHICDSFAEKIIDNWLSDHHLAHQRNIRYPGTKMTADFFIEDHKLLIEFFGLYGVNRKYDTNVKRKIALARSRQLKLLPLYSADLLHNQFVQKLESFLI